MQAKPIQFRTTRRKGMAYLVVLSLGVLVGTIALAAVTAARIQVRTVSASNDVAQAESLAESAVDFALAQVASNSGWRTSYNSNVETTPVAFGGGTISFKLVDEVDGSLSNDATDPVRIYGIGRYGKATKVISVNAEGKSGLTCLNAAICTGGNLTCNQSTINAGSTIVAANGNVTTSGATVNANIEATGTIATISGSGTRTAGVTARGMPASDVLDYYLTKGSYMSPLNLFTFKLLYGGTIQKTLISPTSPPYGLMSSNDLGIYVIDCGGSKITIKNCRIVGTLVILNPGAGSVIGNGGSEGVNWTPAVRNFPCLLVKGDMSINIDSNGTLGEGSTNYNPTGTPYPYPSGSTDTDTSDSYPNIIDGFIYVSGNLTGSDKAVSLGQVIVGGNYDVSKDKPTMAYSPLYFASPPPGFRGGGTLQPISGSWRWETAP